jgi:general secretion pathway protein L
LGSWLPPRLRAVFGLAQQRLLLRSGSDNLTLALTLPAQPGETAIRDLAELPWGATQAAAEEPLTRLLSPRINGLPRWLLLPGSSGLRRRLTLPAAAADRLREVLGFEIDRQTPFTLDEVYYDARLLGRRGDGQIDAELVVIPRASLTQALAALGEPIVSTLSGADMADADGLPLGVNLLPGAQRRRSRDPRAVWNVALAVVALVAAGASLWQIRENREAAADRFEAEAKRHSAQARKVSAEKKQLVDLVEGMRFLQQTRSGRPSTVEVIDEITRRLPDNTYLEKISIEGERIMIIGLSPEAPRLVERLQSSKLWRSMNITGALMPDPTKGKDRFNLSADLAVSAPAAVGGKPRGGVAAADTERAP